MNIFQKKSKNPLNGMSFKSRSEAFDTMLRYLIEEEDLDPMEAAKKADEFADIFSKNMGIPNKVEPELKGIDKYLSTAEKIGNYIEKHPKVVEYGIPALTFLVGLVTGKKVESIENKHDEENNGNSINNKPIDWANEVKD